MSSQTFTAGSLVTSTATFVLTSTGSAADPTTIVLKVLEAGGTVTTYTYPNAFITRVGTGVYSAEIDTTGQNGVATVEWIGTGAVQAIAASSWLVTGAPL